MTFDPAAESPGAGEDRVLVEMFSRRVLERAAPEELVLFDDTAEDYYRDPVAAVRRGGRDEPVGFGLDLPMLTPFVLSIAPAVLSFVTNLLVESVTDELKPRVSRLMRRLVGVDGDADASAAVPTLDAEQLRRVREVSLAHATGLGLAEPEATVLADAIVGGLVRP